MACRAPHAARQATSGAIDEAGQAGSGDGSQRCQRRQLPTRYGVALALLSHGVRSLEGML